MSRAADIHWLYHGVGRYLPEAWARFRAGVPEPDRDADLVAAYHQLLTSSVTAVREQAARDWCDWEDAVPSLEPGWDHDRRYDDPAFRMAFARIVTHFFVNAAWLEDGQLLREVHRLQGIPGVLIHGRLDLGSPAMSAWELAQAWPDAELHLIDTGHTGGDEMTQRIIEGTDRFART
jgi:proline iminopeptidase